MQMRLAKSAVPSTCFSNVLMYYIRIYIINIYLFTQLIKCIYINISYLHYHYYF